MKFLPFDEDDMKRLDKLIAAELPSRENLKEWKKVYMERYRLKKKLEAIQFKDQDLARKRRT